MKIQDFNKVIDGKRYRTETATVRAKWRNSKWD